MYSMYTCTVNAYTVQVHVLKLMVEDDKKHNNTYTHVIVLHLIEKIINITVHGQYACFVYMYLLK